MKCYQFLILCVAFLLCTTLHGQTGFSKDYQNALKFGAKAQLTLAVVDETGQPVSNATCRIGFNDIATSIDVATGVTDKKGIFTGKGRAKWYIGGTVKKGGFYTTTFTFLDGGKPERINNGRWLPWNPTIPVVLRKIKNPIPMYVKSFRGEFPNGETVGFDCEVGDLVSPYGQGRTADFKIVSHVSGVMYKKTSKDILLSAPDADGGFLTHQIHSGSAFKSLHSAPEEGYTANLYAASTYDSGGSGFQGTILYDGNSYLVFKSRITYDSDGKVISANYGKIYGEISYGGGDPKMQNTGIAFLYYFNPTPNDRNLEFDGKNNLFRPAWNSKLNWSRDP